MRRIGGSRRTLGLGLGGGNGEIPLFRAVPPHPAMLGTVAGGSFDWGGRLPNGNGGAQWYPQVGWQPTVECNGTRVLNCETHRSSRDESRP